MTSSMQERRGRPDPVQFEAQGVLRTAYSSPDPEAIIELVRDSYGVPVERARFLRRGLNDTYRLNGANHQQWVFRLYRRWRSAGDVAFETAWLAYLAGRGQPVIGPIASSDGSMFGEVVAAEGVRRFALFPYIDQLSTRPLDADWASCFGRALALLHNASDDFETPARRFVLDASHLLDQPLTAIGDNFVDAPKEVAKLRAAGTRINEILQGLDRRPGAFGPCHGDPHFENFVSAGGKPVWLDFDCGGLGWRMYDLAVVYWALKWKWPAWSVQYAASDDEIWGAFRGAYEAQRPVSQAEWSTFAPFVISRHIWALGLQAANADDWAAHNWLTSEFLATQVQFLTGLAAEMDFCLIV